MRIEILCEQGTVKTPEDRLIYLPPFVGVIDGVSGLYLPAEGPHFFEGRSGGQIVGDIILSTFAKSRKDDDPVEILKQANNQIRQRLQKEFPDLKTQEQYNDSVPFLPGAVFAVVKIGEKEIKIVQCGDALALWTTERGEVGITRNQTFLHDRENIATIKRLMKKHQGDRNKMWQEFSPILVRRRRRNANAPSGYGILNGQPETMRRWDITCFPREGVNSLLLFTDGCVSYLKTSPEKLPRLAKTVLRLWKTGGCQAVLEKARAEETSKKGVSHIDHTEKTIVAIDFS